jgi:hypothetical protein
MDFYTERTVRVDHQANPNDKMYEGIIALATKRAYITVKKDYRYTKVQIVFVSK